MKTLVTVRSIWDPELKLRLDQTTFVTAEDDFFARYPKSYFMTPVRSPRVDQIGRVIDQSVTIENWKERMVKKVTTPKVAPPPVETAAAAKELMTSADLKKAPEAPAAAPAAAPEGQGASAPAPAPAEAPAAPAAAPKAPAKGRKKKGE